MEGLRIVFMGTPEFAVPSLDILIQNGYNIVGVITMPDKAAGRGYKLQESALKKYALTKNLKVLQPEKLKNSAFIEELISLKADLQIVVAFRMLPEIVWNMPKLGTFNLHASLLPQYRGAAPINWAIINGEKETGVTTFFLQHQIDTGRIIFQEKVCIADTDNAGNLHDLLMEVGSKLVLKTVKSIESGDYSSISQENITSINLKEAPKIFKEDCKINWNNSTDTIYNLIRGLSPYPAAFSKLFIGNDSNMIVKIYGSKKEKSNHNLNPGQIVSDNKTFFKTATSDGYIHLLDIQIEGKKRIDIESFLRGFKINHEMNFQ